MRILLSPVEIASQLYYTARGLALLGHQVETAFPVTPSLLHPPNHALHTEPRWRYLLERLRLAVSTLGRFDIYHYYNGLSLLAERYRFLDARLNAALGKKVVVEYCGTDVRIASFERQRNPYYVDGYHETAADEDRKRRWMDLWASLTGGHAIVTDYTVAGYITPHFSQVHLLRHRLDVEAFTPAYPAPETTTPTIVHAPSNPTVKGTPYLRAAVETLKKQGLQFNYIELVGVPHRQVLETIANADIVVDQLCIGYYGVFAVEALCQGKPVICYMLPETVPTYPPDLPIIQANPDTIATVLEEWLTAPGSRRHQCGVASRAYAERTHDYRAITRQVADIYAAL
ncbi:MAG: hypothetical protein BWY76_00826 [bacterium ADurb.Bin429]|nr:MAG: hypothetical protein BWY76_00826 [bacterium ADurb.Bin429]